MSTFFEDNTPTVYSINNSRFSQTLSYGSVWLQIHRSSTMIAVTIPSIFSFDFALRHFNVSGRIRINFHVAGHPPENWMCSVNHLSSHEQAIKILRRSGHWSKALTELNHCEAVTFQVLDHLYGVPSVHCVLDDMIFFRQIVDELLNEVIVDLAALGR